MFNGKILFSVLFALQLCFFASCVCSPDKGFNAAEAEVFYTETAAENWQTEIPADAKKISGNIADGVDVAELCGKDVQEIVFYVAFEAPEKRDYVIGVGCSGSSHIALNGKILVRVPKRAHYRYEAWNKPLKITADKGSNLLAFKVRKEKRALRFLLDRLPAECFEAKRFVPQKRTAPAPEVVRQGGSYRMIVLGDTHYEGYEYHPRWKKDPAKVPPFIAMWQDRLPRLLDSAAAKQNENTRLVVQVGDLVQGGCDDTATHIKVVNDGFAQIKNRFKNVPVVFTPGNHDYQGKIATMSFDDAYFPLMSRELGKKISSRNFYFYIDKDLFISIDFDAPDLDMLKKVIEENTDCRYKFLLTHGAVLPPDKNSFRWYFLSEEPLFSYTRNLLIKHNVIAISGHSHTNDMIDCDAEEGRLTQITASSAWTAEKMIDNKALFTKPEEYGVRQTLQRDKVRFDDIKGALKEYWFAETAGYFVIDVTPEGITAEYYAGDKKDKMYSYKLR